MTIFTLYIGTFKYYLKNTEVRILLTTSVLLSLLANLVLSPDERISLNTAYTILEIKLIILYTIYCLFVLASAFLVQKIECRKAGQNRFSWLPVSFNDLFLVRLLILISITISYWIISVFFVVLFSKTVPAYDTITYSVHLIVPLTPYLLIVTLRSFFNTNFVLGIIELFAYFMSGFIPFLNYSPFSLGYRSLHVYHIRHIYPQTLLTYNDFIIYSWLSLFYSILLVVSVFTLVNRTIISTK